MLINLKFKEGNKLEFSSARVTTFLQFITNSIDQPRYDTPYCAGACYNWQSSVYGTKN
jgi:hypothetical protein